jgi:hypothetical protein
MSQGINFTSLQIASSAAASDKFLIRLGNALSGANGFAQITVTNVEKSLGVYSTVRSNSASWATDSTTDAGVRALTANWQSTYTTFSGQSASNASVYSTVRSNSASWAIDSTTDAGVRALTANWQNTYTTFSSQSASNASTYSTVQSNSSTWSGSSVLSGGTVNQILVKNSNTTGDASWKNKRTTLTLATASGASATISCNALSADQFVVSLSGVALSATFAAPINAYDAQIIMWNVRYTTNIARVILASDFRTPATTLNWSISTNKMDIFAAKYNALDSKWDVVSFAPGYQL